MTTTIAWKALPVGPALSATGTNIVGLFNQLNNYFTSLAANADCHWEVCSFNVAASPYHLVLKRKNGTPGRILFMGVTAAPGAVYNDAMRNYTWSIAGTRAAYFPEATSDVPANLLTNAGEVFTNPGNCTGMTASFATYTGTDTLKLFSSQEGIILRLGGPGSPPTLFWVIGELLERYDEIGINCAGTTATFTSPLALAPTVSTLGFSVRIGGGFAHVGEARSLSVGVQTLLRDLGTKQSWYFPIILGTAQAARIDLAGYKLRQVTTGGVPLAGDEIIYTTGPVERAYAMSSTVSMFLWLTNDKV